MMRATLTCCDQPWPWPCLLSSDCIRARVRKGRERKGVWRMYSSLYRPLYAILLIRHSIILISETTRGRGRASQVCFRSQDRVGQSRYSRDSPRFNHLMLHVCMSTSLVQTAQRHVLYRLDTETRRLVRVLLGTHLEVGRELVVTRSRSSAHMHTPTRRTRKHSRSLSGRDNLPQIRAQELVRLGDSGQGSLQEVALGRGRALGLGVAVLDTGHLEQTLGGRGGDDTGTSGCVAGRED